MSELQAGLTLDFLSQQRQSPFTLMAGDDLGASPILVKPKLVGIWSRSPDHYGDQVETSLRMTHRGTRRLRLYCSRQLAETARLSVHTGEATALGRRTARRTETLTWTNRNSQSLRFTYDELSVEVVDKTRFFNREGHEVSPPVFLPDQGLFYHTEAVTGALVVQYSPEFSLFEVRYDMGEEQMDPDRFREMKLAWLAGNIRDSDIPPVHVIALAEGHATQLSFQRQFWPEGSVGKRGYANEPAPPPFDLLPLLEDLDPCWKKCWQQITGGSQTITPNDYLAISECVASANRDTPLHYVETDRQTQVERIYNQDDADVYIDVERPVSLTMQLTPANGEPTCEGWDAHPYLPEITFRFSQ
ncbi:MAG: hypothetical protein HQL72_00445 [Magnetococcales bacterium]|nr:hypothetical protein [Magnetococcales bacterium]